MTVFLDGQFVPEEAAKVSILDRCFLYGDGVFETFPVISGRPFRCRQHLERLEAGATALGMRLPYRKETLSAYCLELLGRNKLAEGIVRVTLSRGVGIRGYSPRGADHPTLVMTLHSPALNPQTGWNLVTSSVRLAADDPLGAIKSCNKLPQILARMEAESRVADEALLLNIRGEVAETSSGNVFWVDGQVVCTPPLSSPALPGITRAAVREICGNLKLECCERTCLPPHLVHAEGVFVSLSSLGIVEVVSLDGVPVCRSPLTRTLRGAYEALVRSETSMD